MANPGDVILNERSTQEILVVQNPLQYSSVLIDLDDEVISSELTIDFIEEVIHGSGLVVTAGFSSSTSNVSTIQQVYVENNLNVEGSIVLPELEPLLVPTFLPSLEELVTVRLSVADSTVNTFLNKSTTKFLISSSTNNYSLGTRVRSGVLIRNI